MGDLYLLIKVFQTIKLELIRNELSFQVYKEAQSSVPWMGGEEELAEAESVEIQMSSHRRDQESDLLHTGRLTTSSPN